MENMDKIKIICAKCGQIITEVDQLTYESRFETVRNDVITLDGENIIVYEGKYYCPDCQDIFECCYECGEVINVEADDFERDVEGHIYCQCCADSYLSWCERCEEYTRGDVHNVHVSSDGERTEWWCDECVDRRTHSCDDCGEIYSDDIDFDETIHNYFVCNNCRERRYYICEDCEMLVPTDEAYCITNHFYCEDCYDDHRNEAVIASYHQYSTDWRFRRTDLETPLRQCRNKTPFFGVELEIDGGGEYNYEAAIAITGALGYAADESEEFRCSCDSSLNDGFEIISNPATLEWHLTKYDWKAGMQQAEAEGYTSHDANTCGLHFHVDREHFRDSMENPEIGYVIIATNNMDWLKSFSRRTKWDYCEFKDACQFTANDFKENEQATMNLLYDLQRQYHGHNSALNFNGYSTIEIRFIRGTLKHSTFAASLQLMDMMAYAVKHFRKEQLANVNLKWFKRYAGRKEYKEFLAYLEERGIMA